MPDSSIQQATVADIGRIEEPPEYQGAEPLDPEQDDYYYGGKGEMAWKNGVSTSSKKASEGCCNGTPNGVSKPESSHLSSANSSKSSSTSDTAQTTSASSWIPAAQYMAEKAYEYQQRVFDLTAKLAAVEAMCALYTHPSNQDADFREALERIKGVCRREVA